MIWKASSGWFCLDQWVTLAILLIGGHSTIVFRWNPFLSTSVQWQYQNEIGRHFGRWCPGTRNARPSRGTVLCLDFIAADKMHCLNRNFIEYFRVVIRRINVAHFIYNLFDTLILSQNKQGFPLDPSSVEVYWSKFQQLSIFVTHSVWIFKHVLPFDIEKDNFENISYNGRWKLTYQINIQFRFALCVLCDLFTFSCQCWFVITQGVTTLSLI